MAEQQYSNNGPALTASQIVAALLDKLIAKGVLTADDVNVVLDSAKRAASSESSVAGGQRETAAINDLVERFGK